MPYQYPFVQRNGDSLNVMESEVVFSNGLFDTSPLVFSQRGTKMCLLQALRETFHMGSRQTSI
jgi:hypothetical protein